MVSACVSRFDTVDILVNNVGGSAKGGPVEMSKEVWGKQIDFNLKSVSFEFKDTPSHYGTKHLALSYGGTWVMTV